MLESEYEISATFIEELCRTIKAIIIRPEHQPISEYELIKLLRSGHYHTLNSLSMTQADQLFQLHFLIFHALYKLQEELLAKQAGFLEITPLCIRIRPIRQNETSSNIIHQHDKLAEYYLDIKNLTNTTTHEIEQLILSFWKSFQHPDSQLESLKVLQLTPPVSYNEIKKQYKRLASKHHPDKGGSKELIQQINQAMATLSQHYKNGRLSGLS